MDVGEIPRQLSDSNPGPGGLSGQRAPLENRNVSYERGEDDGGGSPGTSLSKTFLLSLLYSFHSLLMTPLSFSLPAY